jgi:hypothetical protein
MDQDVATTEQQLPSLAVAINASIGRGRGRGGGGSLGTRSSSGAGAGRGRGGGFTAGKLASVGGRGLGGGRGAFQSTGPQGQKKLTQTKIMERQSVKTQHMISKLHSLRAHKGQEKREVKKSALVQNMRHEKQPVTIKVKQELVEAVNEKFWNEQYGKQTESQSDAESIEPMEITNSPTDTAGLNKKEQTWDEMYDDSEEEEEIVKVKEKSTRWADIQEMSDEDELYVEDRKKKVASLVSEYNKEVTNNDAPGNTLNPKSSLDDTPNKGKESNALNSGQKASSESTNEGQGSGGSKAKPTDGHKSLTEELRLTYSKREGQVSNAKKRISFADVVGTTQTVLHSNTIPKSTAGHRFEIRFEVKENMKQATRSNEAAVLQEVLKNILKRGKKIDSKMSINTWRDGVDWPTIQKKEDIPEEYDLVKLFVNHPYISRQVHQNFNNGWRIRLILSPSMEWDEFLHHWERSKSTKPQDFVTLKDIPLQKENYFTVGYFLNSGDQQEKGLLQERLSKELGNEVGLAFKPAALDKMTSDHFWKAAKEKAKGERGGIFRYAPMALQVTAESKETAHSTCLELHKKYGRQIDGQYPQLPDGTRMKFVPASLFLDHKSNLTARQHFTNHIAMNAKAVYMPIPIRDPDMEVTIKDENEVEQRKTIGELILSLECEKKHNEPYFRHFSKKWSPRFEERNYLVSVHNEMVHDATKMIMDLEETLIDKYGDEVSEAFVDQHNPSENTFSTTTPRGGSITLQTEDRYGEGGKGQFIITGMENVSMEEPANDITLDEMKQEEKETRSLGVISNFSNLSSQTGRSNSTNPGALSEVTYPTNNHRYITQSQTPPRNQRITESYNEFTTQQQKKATNTSTSIDENEEGWQQVGPPQAAKNLEENIIAQQTAVPADLNKGTRDP